MVSLYDHINILHLIKLEMNNMKKVFIVHGFMGSPKGNWFPWLVSELASRGIFAKALRMPFSFSPSISQWVKSIQKAVGDDQDEIYLVGHSLGVPGILHYLQSIPKTKKIAGVVLVAGPSERLTGPHPRLIDSFLSKPFEFEKIKSQISVSYVIHGDNDPKVPVSHAEKLAKELGSKLIIIPNGLHLNEEDGGYVELPIVLESLLEMFSYK